MHSLKHFCLIRLLNSFCMQVQISYPDQNLLETRKFLFNRVKRCCFCLPQVVGWGRRWRWWRTWTCCPDRVSGWPPLCPGSGSSSQSTPAGPPSWAVMLPGRNSNKHIYHKHCLHPTKHFFKCDMHHNTFDHIIYTKLFKLKNKSFENLYLKKNLTIYGKTNLWKFLLIYENHNFWFRENWMQRQHKNTLVSLW